MNERYVVLRLGAPSGFSYGLAGGVREAETLTAEVEEIDSLEAPAVAREMDVQAIARELPMKLIKPVEFQAAFTPVSTDIAWGIRAVGADRTTLDGRGITVAVLD